MEQQQGLNQEGKQLSAAFERFIDTGISREAQKDLHALIHTAFVAGWYAARQPDVLAERKVPLR